jgi:C-terminal processing protease CtpA/Prc
VIDLRTNGGGNVTNSNLLTKYIADRPFKIADSLYTRNRSSQYSRYQQNHLGNWLFALFLTRKRADGNYHFGYYERKHFKPKRKNHFNGQVYVLSGGNTFSASTLFIKSVGQQKNVVVVGEETGGGAYGNNAWLILM